MPAVTRRRLAALSNPASHASGLCDRVALCVRRYKRPPPQKADIKVANGFSPQFSLSAQAAKSVTGWQTVEKRGCMAGRVPQGQYEAHLVRRHSLAERPVLPS